MVTLDFTKRDWGAFHGAVNSSSRIEGRTHQFYRYPARFSPHFARSAIETFSSPGDMVLDPYMGGGTTVVEAMASGRRAVGTDINSLAVFVASVKTTPLNRHEEQAVREWVATVVPVLTYRFPAQLLAHVIDSARTRNLDLPRARFLKKIIAVAIHYVERLESDRARRFVRCAILQTAQWALDGRRTHTSVNAFRQRLAENLVTMLDSLRNFHGEVAGIAPTGFPSLHEQSASELHSLPLFHEQNVRADLVVTSPPYPGVHMLYHRWQVDGRKETPAPYWMADCQDGQGESYYNFGSRSQRGLDDYFSQSLQTLRSIRSVMRPGAFMVQMIAFSDPDNHIPRYMTNMKEAGFDRVGIRLNDSLASPSLWREVPNRKWHAQRKGVTASAKETVLIHCAV
jgi:hypothetical protein